MPRRRLRSGKLCDVTFGFRACSHCLQLKSYLEFHLSPSGAPVGWCQSCRNEAATASRRAAGVREKKYSIVVKDQKSCLNCLQMLDLSCFYPASRGLGGVASYCKPCFKLLFPCDREKAKAATARYRVKHRERALAAHRIRQHERRHRIEVTADGSVTEAFLIQLYAQPNCFYCNKPVSESNRTADHRVPLSKGGPHTAANLVMACCTCNCSKADDSESAFLRRLYND